MTFQSGLVPANQPLYKRGKVTIIGTMIVRSETHKIRRRYYSRLDLENSSPEYSNLLAKDWNIRFWHKFVKYCSAIFCF